MFLCDKQFLLYAVVDIDQNTVDIVTIFVCIVSRFRRVVGRYFCCRYIKIKSKSKQISIKFSILLGLKSDLKIEMLQNELFFNKKLNNLRVVAHHKRKLNFIANDFVFR